VQAVSIVENLGAVRDRIGRTGRNPDDVAIVAVTKGFGPEACREAVAAGLTALGENRVQEGLTKMASVSGAEWHLIGHLQSNKVKRAAGSFALIQSVDSVRLAEQIALVEPAQRVLLEVNISREPQKAGVAPEAAVDVARLVSRLLPLRGVMAIGPSHGDPLPAFRELKRLRDEAEQKLGVPLPVISMGMSGDFEAALAAGSTMLRLGQVLFGPRPA
jgi:pyridoxal phosphate enzyme (YggS family)